MRAASTRLMTIITSAVLSAPAAAETAHAWRVQAADAPSLREALLGLTEEHFAPIGLFADRRHVWMSLSGALPKADVFEIRPVWVPDGELPPQPLTFELWPAARSAEPARPVEITLAVSWQRDVLVASRRL